MHMCLVMHHTQTHTITVTSSPPKMAEAMVVTDVPSDWSASGAVVSIAPVASRSGSAKDYLTKKRILCGLVENYKFSRFLRIDRLLQKRNHKNFDVMPCVLASACYSTN